MNYQHWVAEHLHVLLVSGSRLYGTHRPDSDYDYRGVCAMPRTALLGLQGFEQYQGQLDGYPSSNDVEVYGLSKFFSLATANNPNILDILFAPPHTWLHASVAWTDVYNNRHLFLSSRVRHTFSGYAIAQLKRLQGHRRWLTGNTPTEPCYADYGGIMVTGRKGAQQLHFTDPQGRADYESAKLLWDNYNRWLRERNPARMATEVAVGYDTKNAAHLTRLLFKCVGILRSGDYDPQLTGNDLVIVKDVLAGRWEYDYLLAVTNNLQAEIERMATPLPHSPDHAAIEGLLMRLNFQDLNHE